jgi:hypothetical protein
MPILSVYRFPGNTPSAMLPDTYGDIEKDESGTCLYFVIDRETICAENSEALANFENAARDFYLIDFLCIPEELLETPDGPF